MSRFRVFAIKSGPSSWSWFLQIGRVFVELNFGRNSPAFSKMIDEARERARALFPDQEQEP